jgi:hypothetical protein
MQINRKNLVITIPDNENIVSPLKISSNHRSFQFEMKEETKCKKISTWVILFLSLIIIFSILFYFINLLLN